MISKRPVAGPFSLELSRCIGRQDYDGAIRHLAGYVTKHPDDAWGWSFLAQCHLWNGSRHSAIEASMKALEVDPDHFEALRLLSAIHAERHEHDQAVSFIRRGLDNLPEPARGIPKLLGYTLRLTTPFLPERLRTSIEEDLPGLRDPNIGDRRWHSWALEYLSWYGQARRASGLQAPD